MKTLKYKGYIAKIEFDKADKIFTGVVLGINDLICFHANDIDAIVPVFHEKREDYIRVSRECGIVPQISVLDPNSLMSDELKKAIQTHIPEYFSWDTKRQEEYRLHLPTDIDFKIAQTLYKDLFGIAVSTDDELNEAWDKLSEEDILKLNATLLPLQGIGENVFYMAENLDYNVSLLDFETLYHYDLDDYNFQEMHRKKSDKSYIEKPYRGSLHWTWSRLMIDGNFYYGTLTMAATHLNAEVDDYGSDYIKKLIPYKFVPGPNHNKDVGNDCRSWDMHPHANGLESELRELQKRFWEKTKELCDIYIDEFDNKSEEEVYIIDESKSFDPSLHFIFSNQRVLRKIHFRTFMKDVRNLEQKDHSLLSKRLVEEKAKIKTFLDEQYKDITKNQAKICNI